MWNDLVNFTVSHGISAIIILAALNFITGIAAAFTLGTFKLTFVGQILHKIAPPLVVFIAVKLLGNDNLAPGILGVITLQFGADVTKNLSEVFGKQIPAILNTTTTKTA